MEKLTRTLSAAALAVTFAMMLFPCKSVAAARETSWRPSVRPDVSDQRLWQFLSCEAGTIEVNCWIGEMPGHICRWRRSSGGDVIIREERYTPAGEFHFASEAIEGTNDRFTISFFDNGRSYYRVSDQRVGRDSFVIDVVVDGKEVARYTSRWDRFAVVSGRIVGVPKDKRLTRGAPFARVERFDADSDRLLIGELRGQGFDTSEPISVEFGFWFEPAHQQQAGMHLAASGCRWLTSEERGGTIGPFPGHCAMTVRLTPETLASWHRRFTKLAQQNGGRYYGWTHARTTRGLTSR